MRRRLLSCISVITLLLPVLAGCGPQRDREAANDIRLYRILPVARTSSLVKAEGEGEAIALINAGDHPHSLSGWTVSTNAGRLTLPKLTMEPGETLYLANDAEYFSAYWHFLPDFEYGEDADQAVPDLKVPEGAVPLLNDFGDVVRLLDDQGKVIDILAYGAVSNPPAPWSGEPARLVGSPALTPQNQVLSRLRIGDDLRLEASAEAWSGGTPAEPERVYYAGQSELPVRRVNGPVTLTAAPTDAGDQLAAWLDGAEKSIRMAGFQFSSAALADRLIAAVDRGVRVQLVVERNPGGSDLAEDDKALHQRLAEAGVEVLYAFPWDGPSSTRYGPIHSKYALIDEETVVISTGDWKESGFGPQPLCGGDRQWVAAIAGNPDVAEMVREVWDADFGALYPDVRRFDRKMDRPKASFVEPPAPCQAAEPDGAATAAETAGAPAAPAQAESEAPAGSETTAAVYPVTVRGNATITRLLSPDNVLDREAGFLGVLRNAREELLVSAVYIDLWWGAADQPANLEEQPNPYLTEILAAARRGVAVKVLLDPGANNLEDQRSNRHVVDYLNGLARREGLNLEARLVDLQAAGIDGLYQVNALVVDDAVVIGSMNGSENSFRHSRELALMVDGLEPFTAHYRALFQQDWQASE